MRSASSRVEGAAVRAEEQLAQYTDPAVALDFFSARDDDVIIMAGYRIGPLDIESVLVEHPDVIEAVVIGVPDRLRGEVIEAFVVLRAGTDGSDELAGALEQLVKTQDAAHAYPRAVHFVGQLPRTPSGKVQRFLLRGQRREQLEATAPSPETPANA